jgi:GT2 family glycosyltransferase
LGIIVIGRNEGPRLVACLESIHKSALPAGRPPVVYVDSNSTDNSVAEAARLGASVILLDKDAPFTAARARNAGAEALLKAHPDTTYIQFLDGDTELDSKWLAHAADYLDHHPLVAVVSGRLRERYPDQTLYNLLADMEWDAPAGPATEFGGIAMIRAALFTKLGGYNPAFIAGEEPDLAARLRLHAISSGKAIKIIRLNHQMALHDLAMTRFSQWWRRTRRSGHALAQLYHAHGRRPLHFYKKQFRSTLFWTLPVPLAILLLALLISKWLLLLLPLAYLTLAFRIARHRTRHGDGWHACLLYGVFTTLAKFPQLLGLITFYRNHRRGRQTALIEYKPPASPLPANPTPAPVGNT